MTNAEKAKRGFTAKDACGLCSGQVEDITHLLRSCLAASSIWIHFLSNDEMLI